MWLHTHTYHFLTSVLPTVCSWLIKKNGWPEQYSLSFRLSSGVLPSCWLAITWTSHYQHCLEVRHLRWPHHKQWQHVAQLVQLLTIIDGQSSHECGVWDLGVVPRTNVSTLIIPARLLLWVTEVQCSTNATACRGCCFLCCLYPFISGNSWVVLSLLMPVWLLMGCVQLWVFLSSPRLCLSWDNRHDLAN